MIVGQVEQMWTAQRKAYSGQNLAVTLAAGLTDLIEIPCASLSRVFGIITNNGANPFNTFALLAKIAGGIKDNVAFQPSAYVTLYNTGFAAPTGILQGTSGDLTVLGAGATGWFFIDVSAIDTLKVQAGRSAVTNASIWIQGGPK